MADQVQWPWREAGRPGVYFWLWQDIFFSLIQNTQTVSGALPFSLLDFLLPYSMMQSPSSEANRFSVSQGIPHILWNPKVHYRTHKRPPTVPVLGQPNPVHIPTSHLLEIHPNIIHPSTTGSSKCYLSLLLLLLLSSSSSSSLTTSSRVLLEKVTGFQLVKKFPAFLWNPKVHYRTHKRPPTVPVLGQPNPVHIPTSHLLEIHLNIIHPSKPRSPQWALSLRFPHQDPIRPPLLTHTRHMPSPSHSSRLYHPHNIGWGVQIIWTLASHALFRHRHKRTERTFVKGAPYCKKKVHT